MTANGVLVEKADIEASNGVIHILETPMLTTPSAKIGDYLVSDRK